MKSFVIKVIIRALASIWALLGLSMLFFSLTLFLPNSIKSRDGFSIGISAFGILLGCYFCYVGFLGWLRFSPLAVRHILRTLAFMQVGTIGRAEQRFEFNDSPEFTALCFFGGWLLFYLLYRWVVSYCCRQLFPIPLNDVNPQVSNA
jgi:hypothetical protein